MNGTPVQHWLDSSLGAAVLELEAAIVADALADVFGFELVQNGGWGRPGTLVAAARPQHHRWLAPHATGPGALPADYAALPNATGSSEDSSGASSVLPGCLSAGKMTICLHGHTCDYVTICYEQ